MELDKLFAGVERFFYDIIGSLIPGSILLAGLWWLAGKPIELPSTSAGWLMFTAVAFVVGSAVATLAEILLVPIAARALQGFKELKQATAEKDSFKMLAHHVFPGVQMGESSFSQLRNIALSIIPADDRATVIRFMFLSLMSLGSALVVLLLTVAALYFGWDALTWPNRILTGVVGLVLLITLLVRRFEFFNRAQRLPFDMAAAQLTIQGRGERQRPLNSVAVEGGIQSVYLAGGHRTQWRKIVSEKVPGLHYRDPSLHDLRDARAYTAWDLEAIRQSDLMFAYLEASNPSGFGLAVEVGYAAALGKHVIFVDEKSAADDDIGRYLGMIHQTASVSFTTLDEGIRYLDGVAAQLSPAKSRSGAASSIRTVPPARSVSSE